MRYKEYIEEVKKLGLEIEDNYQVIYVIDTDGKYLSEVYKDRPFVMDTVWSAFNYLDDDMKSKVLDLNYQLARTSLEDREDEKRFIIPLPWLVTSDNDQQYLTNKGGYFFASRRNKKLKQTWTENELNFIPDEYAKFAVEFDEEIGEKDDI